MAEKNCTKKVKTNMYFPLRRGGDLRHAFFSSDRAETLQDFFLVSESIFGDVLSNFEEKKNPAGELINTKWRTNSWLLRLGELDFRLDQFFRRYSSLGFLQQKFRFSYAKSNHRLGIRILESLGCLRSYIYVPHDFMMYRIQWKGKLGTVYFFVLMAYERT